MATTNYSLPTLESTALFDLVTDYIALANATDAALARVAGHIPTETITEMQGQISSLQTLTGSQGSQITTLQSQMTTANGNISTLKSGLETANSNIGTFQTGLQSANSNISSLQTTANNLSKLFAFTDVKYTGNEVLKGLDSISSVHVNTNYNNSIIKFWGNINLGTSSYKRTLIPGLLDESSTQLYGIKLNINISNWRGEANLFSWIGIYYQSISGGNTNNYYNDGGSLGIGTDGYFYLDPKQSSGNFTSNSSRYSFLQCPLFIGSPISFSADEL